MKDTNVDTNVDVTETIVRHIIENKNGLPCSMSEKVTDIRSSLSGLYARQNIALLDLKEI